MPSPWEVLEAAASGLDPREVWRNTASTFSTVMNELDRPRGAVQGSQVESQGAGSFLSMLGLAAQGAAKGFNNPQDYPADGFIQSILTDPLAVVPGDELRFINQLVGQSKVGTGGRTILANLDDLFGVGARAGSGAASMAGRAMGAVGDQFDADIPKQMLNFLDQFGDTDLPKPVRNALIGAVRKLDGTDEAFFRLFDTLEKVERMPLEGPTQRMVTNVVNYLDNAINSMPGAAELGERYYMPRGSDGGRRMVDAVLDTVSDFDEAIRTINEALQSGDIKKMREAYKQANEGFINIADEELEAGLESLRAALVRDRADSMQEALRFRRRESELPGDRDAIGIQPGVEGGWAQAMQPDTRDPRDAIFEMLGMNPPPSNDLGDQLLNYLRNLPQ